MGTTCAPAPANKKEYVSDLAKLLVKENGKKKYYKPEEVVAAHRKSKWYEKADFVCWGMCTFSSHSDFDRYHAETGEICDYTEMKTEMLSGLSVVPDASWKDIPDLDVDASWLDLGDGLDGVFEGVGDFFGGILDGI